jgi:DNA-binding response OmpR family regulator
MAVDLAGDAGEAAGKLDLNDYEVVVLDQVLASQTGAELCRDVADREAPAMVLMLGASAAPEERGAGLVLGADDDLATPLHLPELVRRVQSLARRRPEARRRVLVADVALEPVRHRATRGGRPLGLSAKEFALLQTLLDADGAVLSAEQLLERAWDEHVDPVTNPVQMTMSRLRRKLGGPPVIETVPGVGYRIVDEQLAVAPAPGEPIRRSP